MKSPFKFSIFLLIILSTSFGSTWTGNGSSNNWTDVSNWVSNPTYTSNSSIDFGTSVKVTTIANGSNWNIKDINFGFVASSYDISGQTLNISNGINNQSTGLQKISNQINVTSNQTWTNSGTLKINGYVSSNNKNLTLVGNQNSYYEFNGQLNSFKDITINGSGNTKFSTISNSKNLYVNNSGTNSFNGQLNFNKIEIANGSNTFNSTVNVQSNGIIFSGANTSAVFNGSVNSGAGGIQAKNGSNLTFNGQINSAGSLSITDGSTVTLSGTGLNNISNTYVDGGTLILDQENGFSINGQLTVMDGGVVQFEGDSQIPTWQNVTLEEGATLLLNDTDQQFNNLVVNGNSIIDFGDNGSSLSVNNLIVNSDVTITIKNWITAIDEFMSISNPNNSVVNIYYEDYGYTASWNSYDKFITPGTPVPEPSSYGFIMIGSIVSMFLLKRKRRN